MWGAGTCWSCAVRLAAEYIRGSWRSKSPETHRCGTSTEQALDDENVGARLPPAQRVKEGQRILGVTAIRHSTVIVAYPKITELPALVRRKLGGNHWNLIHEGIQGRKRDASICATDYSLCPQSLGGGCCPTDRVCGSSSCYPSSAAATASGCGQEGYFNCGVEEGGGCCPTSYICGVGSCTPSPGVTYSQTCSADQYLCAASFGYGCCKSGFDCWYNSCYATASVTFAVTETLTTTNANSNLETITTTITTATIPGLPTGIPPTDVVITQITQPASPIPKSAASSVSSGGLTTPELGGIIGGAIFILIALLIATFIIVRRLNKAIKVTEMANSRTSSSGPRSGRSGPRPIDVDALSVDPLMMSPSEAGGSIRRPSQFSNTTNQIHELDTDSPPQFKSPFSPGTPPYVKYKGGYKPVSTTSESIYSRSTRQDSVELPTPPQQQNTNAGYFDIPPQSTRQRGSADSTPSAMTRRTSHGRQWSNASDVSQGSNASNPAELDVGTESPKANSRRSSGSFTKTLQDLGVGMSRMVSFRRRSDPPVLTGGPVRTEKPDWKTNTAYLGAGQGLGHIPEAGESRINLENEAGISNAQMREIALKDPQSPIVKEGTRVFSQEITGDEVPEFLMGNEPGSTSS